MALPTLDATFASAADLPRRQMLARWLVEELGETQTPSDVLVSGLDEHYCTDPNGTYTYFDTFNGKPRYQKPNRDDPVAITDDVYWNGSQWEINACEGDVLYFSEEDVAYPWLVASWEAINGFGNLVVVEIPQPSPLSNYYSLPERYLWAKIAVAAGGPKDEAAYIGLPKQYAWKDIYDAVSGSSLGTIDWVEKQALGHIAAAYRGDTANPENLATYIDWPWRYQVASIIGGAAAPNPWDTILNSSYASNIVAAYDFRDFNGSEVVAKIGPNLETNSVTDVSDGLSFIKGNGSWAFANSTVSCTYPFTMAYIANTTTDLGIEDVLINCSESRFGADVIVFTRGNDEQGLMPYNGTDNQDTGYLPNGSEWYYFAVSFLNNGTVRYATRKLSGNLNGTVTGSNGFASFNGYVGFAAGFGSQAVYNTTGIYRSAFFINQGFSTAQQMEDLFNILSVSADGLTIQ